MEETKRKLYVERTGFWTEAAMLFMVLAMVFRVIGSIGRWDDMNYLITLVALPVFCGLLFLLCLLCFGKRAFWTSVVPVVVGVVFFIFQIMTVEDNLLKVGLISLCVVIVVLYAMTFSHPALKWLLALVLLGVFGYLVGVKDLPKLLDPEQQVGFVEGMQEMSVLGILLSLLCVSLAMRVTGKAPEETPQTEEEQPREEAAEQESPAAFDAPAPAVSPLEPAPPAPDEPETPPTPPAPDEPPAAPDTQAKPKKLSWRERRKARKEKDKQPEPPAPEEELFPFPMPEPEPEPAPPFPPELEQQIPASGSIWEVHYEDAAEEPAPQDEAFPEPDAYPEPDAFPEPDAYPEQDAYPEHHYFPEENYYPEEMDEAFPEPVRFDEPPCSPEPDFDGEAEALPAEPLDFTPVEEVPITKKTPFAEPAEIYPLEGPGEEQPGPTDP